MPRGDKTGPYSGGPGTGSGGGRGRMSGNRPGAGPAGSCVCPDCGTKALHRAGVQCSSVNCPKCGAKMARE